MDGEGAVEVGEGDLIRLGQRLVICFAVLCLQIFGGNNRGVCGDRRGNVIWTFCVFQGVVGIDRLLKSDNWLLCA